MYRLTLGRAQYRAGDPGGAILSLEKAEVGGEDVCVRALFLALAYAAAGNPTQAGEWYGRADRWLAAHREILGSRPQTATELRRLHAEAARALGGAKPEGKGAGDGSLSGGGGNNSGGEARVRPADAFKK